MNEPTTAAAKDPIRVFLTPDGWAVRLPGCTKDPDCDHPECDTWTTGLMGLVAARQHADAAADRLGLRVIECEDKPPREPETEAEFLGNMSAVDFAKRRSQLGLAVLVQEKAQETANLLLSAEGQLRDALRALEYAEPIPDILAKVGIAAGHLINAMSAERDADRLNPDTPKDL